MCDYRKAVRSARVRTPSLSESRSSNKLTRSFIVNIGICLSTYDDRMLFSNSTRVHYAVKLDFSEILQMLLNQSGATYAALA